MLAKSETPILAAIAAALAKAGMTDVMIEGVKKNIEVVGECTNWNGRNSQTGPSVPFRGKTNMSLHRLIYEGMHGRSLTPTDAVLRTCACPHCLNPSHLELKKVGSRQARPKDPTPPDEVVSSEQSNWVEVADGRFVNLDNAREVRVRCHMGNHSISVVMESGTLLDIPLPRRPDMRRLLASRSMPFK